MNKTLFAQVILALMLFVLVTGCGTTYRIEVVEGDTYLESSKGDDVKVGDVFELYTTSTIKQEGGRPAPPKYKKTAVARIKVTKLVDAAHASFVVLDGQIRAGLKAKKVEEGR